MPYCVAWKQQLTQSYDLLLHATISQHCRVLWQASIYFPVLLRPPGLLSVWL